MPSIPRIPPRSTATNDPSECAPLPDKHRNLIGDYESAVLVTAESASLNEFAM